MDSRPEPRIVCVCLSDRDRVCMWRVCVDRCMHACMHACTYTHIYVYIYTYTDTVQRRDTPEWLRSTLLKVW